MEFEQRNLGYGFILSSGFNPTIVEFELMIQELSQLSYASFNPTIVEFEQSNTELLVDDGYCFNPTIVEFEL